MRFEMVGCLKIAKSIRTSCTALREMAEPPPGAATTATATLLLQSFARGVAVRREARRREHSAVVLQAWARRLSAQGAARRICATLAKQRRSAVELRERMAHLAHRSGLRYHAGCGVTPQQSAARSLPEPQQRHSRDGEGVGEGEVAAGRQRRWSIQRSGAPQQQRTPVTLEPLVASPGTSSSASPSRSSEQMAARGDPTRSPPGDAPSSPDSSPASHSYNRKGADGCNASSADPARLLDSRLAAGRATALACLRAARTEFDRVAAGLPPQNPHHEPHKFVLEYGEDDTELFATRDAVRLRKREQAAATPESGRMEAPRKDDAAAANSSAKKKQKASQQQQQHQHQQKHQQEGGSSGRRSRPTVDRDPNIDTLAFDLGNLQNPHAQKAARVLEHRASSSGGGGGAPRRPKQKAGRQQQEQQEQQEQEQQQQQQQQRTGAAVRGGTAKLPTLATRWQRPGLSPLVGLNSSSSSSGSSGGGARSKGGGSKNRNAAAAIPMVAESRSRYSPKVRRNGSWENQWG
jgi:hypothetical protein